MVAAAPRGDAAGRSYWYPPRPCGHVCRSSLGLVAGIVGGALSSGGSSLFRPRIRAARPDRSPSPPPSSPSDGVAIGDGLAERGAVRAVVDGVPVRHGLASAMPSPSVGAVIGRRRSLRASPGDPLGS